MSRSGYRDDIDDLWAHIRWRGAVVSATKGQRGQAFFRELLAALDAMPEKRLVRYALESAGEVCAIGCALRARGSAMPDIHEDDWDEDARDELAKVAGIASALAAEIMYWNDEGGGYKETPEGRWIRIRAWVAKQLAGPERKDYISDEFHQKAVAKWQAKQPKAEIVKE